MSSAWPIDIPRNANGQCWIGFEQTFEPTTNYVMSVVSILCGELSWRFKLRKYGGHYLLAFPRYARRSCVEMLQRDEDWCKWICIVVEFLLTARRRSIRLVPIGEKNWKQKACKKYCLVLIYRYVSIDEIDSIKFIHVNIYYFSGLGAKQ